MRKKDENVPPNFPEVHPYITLFQRHVDQLRHHLTGASPKSSQEPSFVAAVYWEASEKDAFFHALSVYSRLRPDLIATCIGTKNQAEVLGYMTLLEQGLRDVPESEVVQRKNFYLAHEVSDAWIDWEEENADRLRVNEEIWTTDASTTTTVPASTTSVDQDELMPIDHKPISPLGGISYLTQGHLVVLDSMLKTGNGRLPITGAEMVHPNIDCPTQTTGLMNKTGIDPSTQLMESSSLSTSNGTMETDRLDQSPVILSQTDIYASGEDEPSPQGLSPESRRRYQKRMYMRRKRAQSTGTAVQKTIAKLRSGPRKQSPTHANMMSGDQGLESGSVLDTTADEAHDPTGTNGPTELERNQEDDSSPINAGSRIHYKTIVSDFQLRRVNAESVAAAGLDVFNLRKFGRLARKFISGYDSDLIKADASIQAETLILLFEILKDFLIQTIARVIVLEEEHQRLRGKARVWNRNSDEETQQEPVDKSAIQFALKMMGEVNENLDQYFADFLAEDYEHQSQLQTGYSDNERLVNGAHIFCQHPLHSDLYPPHYLTPEQRLPFSSSKGMGANDLEIVMEVDTDVEGFNKVMSEEEALDKEDALADLKHEDSLWEEVPYPQKRLRKLRSALSKLNSE